MDEDSLRLLVMRVVNGGGTVRETWHSKYDRAYRNITMHDIVCGLRYSWVCTSQSWDDEHCSWEYELKTVDVEGDDLTLRITANQELERVEIITKY